MATNKTGLDYFPFDVNFFDDDKLLFVGARFGLKGENIAIRLLCKIYSEGYFYKFGEDEALLFAKRVGDGCQYSFVNDVVYELVKRGFFDRSIFDRFALLTSIGIQKRYFEAVNRRKNIEVFEDLLLIDVSKMDNVNILSPNDYIIDKNGNISRQKKVKEKKEKKSKEISPVGDTKKGAPCGASPSPYPPDVYEKDLQECKDELFNDRMWIELLCMNNHLSPEQLSAYLDNFFIILQNRGETTKTLRDAKHHFASWLQIELKQKGKKDERNQGSGSGNETQPVWGAV